MRATHSYGWMAFAVAIWLIASAAATFPTLASAEIIWRGDFNEGNFRKWHSGEADKPNLPWYWTVPRYGRPAKMSGDFSSSWHDANYYGNGELLQLSSAIARGGKYSARMRVKSNGTTEADWDGSNGTRRRTEVSIHGAYALSALYNALPYLSTRWVSVSVYIPTDWSSSTGTGSNSFGPLVWQSKHVPDVGVSPPFAIHARPTHWEIVHHWTDQIPASWDNIVSRQYGPNSTRVPSAHYAEGQASRDALADLNKGGWTDWVMQFHYDARTVANGGKGFWRVWQRRGNGNWVQVLNITPDTVDGPDGRRLGIGYPAPPVGGSGSDRNGGYTMQVGLYGGEREMLGNFPDRVVHIDNVKIGSENTRFEEMTHDGSSPGSEVAPPAPPSVSVQ